MSVILINKNMYIKFLDQFNRNVINRLNCHYYSTKPLMFLNKHFLASQWTYCCKFDCRQQFGFDIGRLEVNIPPHPDTCPDHVSNVGRGIGTCLSLMRFSYRTSFTVWTLTPRV